MRLSSLTRIRLLIIGLQFLALTLILLTTR
jgi:hypothetical protein